MSLLATIHQSAQEHKLPFLLAGGHAVIAHGFPRSTFDLDLIIRRSDRDSWTGMMAKLGYGILHEGFGFLQLSNPDKTMTPVDLMFVNDSTFDKLLADAAPAPVDGARVVSLHHLLALKCHAIKFGHIGRIEKDLDDVLYLLRVNKLDVTRPDLRELILKHGTKELYEKLERSQQSERG